MSLIIAGEWKPRIVGSVGGLLGIRIPFDLTNATGPEVSVWEASQLSGGTPKVDARACTITVISTTLPESRITWEPLAADVDTEGTYLAVFSVTDASKLRRFGYVRLRIDGYGPPFT